jgi:hypothetical protein
MRTSKYTEEQKKAFTAQLKTNGGDKTGEEVAALAGVSRNTIDVWNAQAKAGTKARTKATKATKAKKVAARQGVATSGQASSSALASASTPSQKRSATSTGTTKRSPAPKRGGLMVDLTNHADVVKKADRRITELSHQRILARNADAKLTEEIEHLERLRDSFSASPDAPRPSYPMVSGLGDFPATPNGSSGHGEAQEAAEAKREASGWV